VLIHLSLVLFSKDPFQSDEEGWSDAGYYVTGCSKAWMSLELVEKIEDTVEDTKTSVETLEGKETLIDAVVEDKVTSSAAYFMRNAFTVSVIALAFLTNMVIHG
jgi:hypothetical protein